MMKKLILSTLLSISLVSGISAATLELRPEASVVGKAIRLIDVLQSATDLPEGLMRRNLGNSPAFGHQRVISRALVENHLRGVDVEWVGPRTCKVRRPSSMVNPEWFRDKIEAELRELTQEMGDVHVEEFADARAFHAPIGNVEVQVSLSANVLKSAWSVASVKYMWNGEALLLRSIRFRWSWERGIWLANKSLERGEMVREEDFTEVVDDVLKYSGNAFVGDLSDLDMTLVRSLAPGTVLTGQAMKDRTLVFRGNKVVVNYDSEALKISMKGTALEDGSIGQKVAVRNDSSKKKVYARVAGEGILMYEE